MKRLIKIVPVQFNKNLPASELLRLWKVVGLPTSGRWKRPYQRLWARRKRIDLAVRVAEAKKSKAWREKNPERAKKAISKWRARNKKKLSEYNRKYHDECRARRCHGCGRHLEPGRATVPVTCRGAEVRLCRGCYTAIRGRK